jgi:hypothetical protein
LQKVSRAIEEVLERLTVWELREGAEESAQVDSTHLSVDDELVRIEISGGNHGR